MQLEVIDLEGTCLRRSLKEAVERQVALVGLSAPMTTTVPSMEENHPPVRAASATVKVMVEAPC